MASVELWGGSSNGLVVVLESDRTTIGSAADSADIVVDDPTVSALHVILERIGSTWLVRDLGSRNGTKVNGVELSIQTQLRHGDTMHLGRTRVTFSAGAAGRRPVTETINEPPPDITPAERRVLVELCRPLLLHDAFQTPASVSEIAERLNLHRNSVQSNLVRLYDKFGIHAEPHAGRRVALANQAVQRGAVTKAGLEAAERGEAQR